MLLVLGAVALIGLVPMLWSWLLYGSGLGQAGIYLGAIGLFAIAAAIGFGMLRILDGRR